MLDYRNEEDNRVKSSPDLPRGREATALGFAGDGVRLVVTGRDHSGGRDEQTETDWSEKP